METFNTEVVCHANGMVLHVHLSLLFSAVFVGFCSLFVKVCVSVYVWEDLCMMSCTVFLQGDEGPLGPPGGAGPTVRTLRFTYCIYTHTTHTHACMRSK